MTGRAVGVSTLTQEVKFPALCKVLCIIIIIIIQSCMYIVKVILTRESHSGWFMTLLLQKCIIVSIVSGVFAGKSPTSSMNIPTTLQPVAMGTE